MIPSRPPATENTAFSDKGTTAQSAGVSNAGTMAAEGELGGRAAGSNKQPEGKNQQVLNGGEGKREHVGMGGDASGVTGGGGGQK